MIVLLGDTRHGPFLKTMKSLGWGRMCVAMKPKPYEFEPWAFDNECFPPWQQAGCPIGVDDVGWCLLWDGEAYEKRLAKARTVNSDPLFAVVPDIPGGGLNSLSFSVEWRMQWLPEGWPWYLAVQDGMSPEQVEPHLHIFQGVFLGGSDSFKRQAGLWCDFAHHHQKKFHYARCGTSDKLKHAHEIGADSIDSALTVWEVERFNQFVRDYCDLENQGNLFAASQEKVTE